MAIDRNNPASLRGTGSSTQANSTVTDTLGAQTSTQNSSNWQNQTTSQSSSSKSSTRGGKSGKEVSVKDIDITKTNMTPTALAALEATIKQLMQGGSESDKKRREDIQREIATNRAQQADYSKEAAWADSEAAAAASIRQGIEESMPLLIAGIDSAGTSGSAMAALLAERNAQSIADVAAQQRLNAAVQYGQVKNQASGIIRDLLAIEDPTSANLISALNIAKGAVEVTKGRETTTTTRDENWWENTNSSSSSTSSTNTVGGGTTTTETGPQTNVRRTEYDQPKAKNSMGGWSTPSSYSRIQ